MNSDPSNMPRHLEDQMTFYLKRSMKETFKAFGQKHGIIRIRPTCYDDFKHSFNRLRADILPKMSKQGLDAHKLASIACLSVMLSQPLYIGNNDDRHAANETLAFILASKIIRDYQIMRIVPDKSKWGGVKARIGTLVTPDLIYDTQAVNVNTIFALRHLSRALRESSKPADFILHMS